MPYKLYHFGNAPTRQHPPPIQPQSTPLYGTLISPQGYPSTLCPVYRYQGRYYYIRPRNKRPDPETERAMEEWSALHYDGPYPDVIKDDPGVPVDETFGEKAGKGKGKEKQEDKGKGVVFTPEFFREMDRNAAVLSSPRVPHRQTPRPPPVSVEDPSEPDRSPFPDTDAQSRHLPAQDEWNFKSQFADKVPEDYDTGKRDIPLGPEAIRAMYDMVASVSTTPLKPFVMPVQPPYPQDDFMGVGGSGFAEYASRKSTRDVWDAHSLKPDTPYWYDGPSAHGPRPKPAKAEPDQFQGGRNNMSPQGASATRSTKYDIWGPRGKPDIDPNCISDAPEYLSQWSRAPIPRFQFPPKRVWREDPHPDGVFHPGPSRAEPSKPETSQTQPQETEMKPQNPPTASVLGGKPENDRIYIPDAAYLSKHTSAPIPRFQFPMELWREYPRPDETSHPEPHRAEPSSAEFRQAQEQEAEPKQPGLPASSITPLTQAEYRALLGRKNINPGPPEDLAWGSTRPAPRRQRPSAVYLKQEADGSKSYWKEVGRPGEGVLERVGLEEL